jgi:hypothetical protein
VDNAGKSSAARTAMMEMTTSISTRVNARTFRLCQRNFIRHRLLSNPRAVLFSRNFGRIRESGFED